MSPNNTHLFAPFQPAFGFKDRMGKKVSTGDLVYIQNKTDTLWRVIDIKPVVDPQAPPGMIQIIMASEFTSALKNGSGAGDVIKVLDNKDLPALPTADPQDSAVEPDVERPS